MVGFEFVAFDDHRCVYAHPVVGAGLSWRGTIHVFSHPVCANFTPLAWLSHMADMTLFGREAGGHHLTSLALHVLNTLLLFGLLRSTTGALGRSALVSALFALHPLHVESVAWVAERRDVLSGTFALGSLWAYARWARGGGAAAYVLVGVLLALGLGAKAMLVTLPLLFLLLDIWPLRRWPLGRAEAGVARGRLVLEKLPFGLLAAAAAWAALHAQTAGGGVPADDALPFDARLANALVSYVAYLAKTLWPSGLAVLYPHPNLPGGADPWTALQAGAAGLLVLALCAGAWRLRRFGYPLVGWLWYAVGLAPVIGIVQLGQAARADRYTYLPLVGIFIVVVWGAHAGFRRIRPGPTPAAALLAVLAIAAFSAVTWRQIDYWRDSITLFERAAEVTRGNFSAHFNLGNLYHGQGDARRAQHHFERAVAIHPKMARAHARLADLLREDRQLDGAIEHYALAARHSQGVDLEIWNALAATGLERDGTHAVMIAFVRELLDAKPEVYELHATLATFLRRDGELDAAITAYRRALALAPGDAGLKRALEDTVAQKRRRGAPAGALPEG